MSPAIPRTHNDRHGYRAPQQCPVCAEELHITQLGCDACGTGISGHFQHCSFCALGESELDVLQVFLAARGNMKELERHLGVSYPTARARFDDLLAKLGLRSGPGTDARSTRDVGPTPNNSDGPPDTDDSSRLATLQALASGALDVETARRHLGP